MTPTVNWPTAPHNRDRPLAGVRVLDVSRILAGPYCAMLLADLGADVIKVEPPQGDETRRWGPPFHEGNAAYYFVSNRNKHGLELDLRRPESRDILTELIRQADVVITNYTDRIAREFGLDYDAVKAVNDSAVYLVVSGFGPTEPDRPGYDMIVQAMGGLMAITGPADGEPTKVGVAISDITAALFSTIGVLAALKTRDATGRGTRLDVNLYDSTLALLTNQAMNSLFSDVEPQRLGNVHPNVTPYGTYRAADGPIALAVATDSHFYALCDILGIGELGADPRFTTNSDRVAHRDELTAALEAALGQHPGDEWLARLAAARIPSGPVRSVSEALQAPEARSVSSVEHPAYGSVPQLLTPIQFDQQYLAPYLAPPTQNEHGSTIVGGDPKDD